jgi:hypothetical protein
VAFRDLETGVEYTRVGKKLIADALPAVPSGQSVTSSYADYPEEFFDGEARYADDYGIHGLGLGPAFRESLNQTLRLAEQIHWFEAVHHELYFGCPMEEMRSCVDALVRCLKMREQCDHEKPVQQAEAMAGLLEEMSERLHLLRHELSQLRPELAQGVER